MPRVARHVRVTGRVQGVFFRQTTVDRARELGVAGWVRNCPDGSVEALLSGEPDAVETMTEWLHHGPPHARVARVLIEDAEPLAIESFEVRRV